MRILIVEPHADGHHASYLRWLLQAVGRRHWTAVIATTAEALAHPSLNGIIAEFGDVGWHIMKDIPRGGRRALGYPWLVRREFAYWREFQRATRQVSAKMSIDAVILPYVDYCFFALAILRSPFHGHAWCGISMRLRIAAGRRNGSTAMPFKWRAARRLLGDPGLKALFVINPSVQNVPTKWWSPTMASKLRYLRDPAEIRCLSAARDAARAALGIEDNDVAMLVFGSLDERKGIDSLLTALSTGAGLDDYIVILGGKQSAAVQSQLRAGNFAGLHSRNRLIVMDRYLTDAEQAQAFAAADAVWVGYRQHDYMSGVLVLAGQAALPVVGTREGEIGRLIAQHGLGVAAGIHDQPELQAALRTLLDARQRVAMGERGRAALAGHSVENFGADVLECLGPTPGG